MGIDVIDGHLSEINVTSPTGIREVERLAGVPLADLVQQRLLQGAAPWWPSDPSAGGQVVAGITQQVQLLLQNPQLQGHLLQFALGLGAADQTGPGRRFQLVSAQGAAADRHPQVGVTGAVDPADWGGVVAALEGLQAAQPGHRLAPRQARHSGGGMEGGGDAQGLVLAQGCRDRGVQMHQLAVAGQPWMARSPRVEARSGEYGCDRVHHQLMLMAIFAGVQQPCGLLSSWGGAR